MSTHHSDPRTKYPTPPYPEHDQINPGSDARMSVKADHGETSYRGNGKLQGRAALITGADSGIGRAVALAYAREGADVLISYLNEDEDARETARLVEEAGRKAVLMPGDISQEAHCQALLARVQQEFGRLDVLVNNAAYQMPHEDIGEIPAEDLHHTYGEERHPGERRRTRPDLDAADPLDPRGRGSARIWQADAPGTGRAAGGSRPGVRVTRLGRRQLHHGDGLRRHRRDDYRLMLRSCPTNVRRPTTKVER